MTTIPRTLETPPRTTGNAQQDFPLIVDWMFRAYQVIQQSVAYINSQVESGDVELTNLPDPATATVSSAQQTANLAYQLASGSQDGVDSINSSFLQGTVTVSDASTGETVAFSEEQSDNDYVVMIQPKSSSGSPALYSDTIKTKTYGTTDFSFTVGAAPGAGKSVTFDWVLMRNI